MRGLCYPFTSGWWIYIPKCNNNRDQEEVDFEVCVSLSRRSARVLVCSDIDRDWSFSLGKEMDEGDPENHFLSFRFASGFLRFSDVAVPFRHACVRQ